MAKRAASPPLAFRCMDLTRCCTDLAACCGRCSVEPNCRRSLQVLERAGEILVFPLFPFARIERILPRFDQPRSLVMIVLPIAMLMAAAGPGSAPAHERQAFGQCLSKFVHDKLEA